MEEKKVIKGRKLPSVMRKPELVKFFNRVENPVHAITYMMTVFHGLRLYDIVNLKTSNINLDNGVLEIKKGKFSKDRNIPIPSKLMPIIRKYLVLRRYYDDSDYFIPRRRVKNNKSLGNVIYCQLRADLKRAGLLIPSYIDMKGNQRYKYHFHTLRHSYATHLYEKRIDLNIIKTLLGHSNTKTTEIYTHIGVNRLREEVDNAFDSHLSRFQQKCLEPEVVKTVEQPKIEEPISVLQLQLAKGLLTTDEYKERLGLLQPIKQIKPEYFG